MNRAYEKPNGAALDFNFWMDKSGGGIDSIPYLLDSDITQAIRDLMHARTPKYLSKRHQTHSGSSLLVVAIHALDLNELEWLLPKISFLHERCSYMPIRHMNTMTALSARNRKSISANQSQQQQRPFQYMEVDSMNSLILWPEKAPIRKKDLTAVSVSELFRAHKVILKVNG